MEVPLVITIIAQDRPGLVESLAGAIARHGGNWLESRMSRLGGQFAGIVRASLPDSAREKLIGELKGLEASGIKFSVQSDAAPAAAGTGALVELNLIGQDRPGIVRQISQALAQRDVNVEDLSTECSSAPMSGENLFHARAKLKIPASCSLETLRSELEKIASDLMVDLTLREIPASAQN